MFYTIMFITFLITAGIAFICAAFGIADSTFLIVDYILAGASGILAGIALAVKS